MTDQKEGVTLTVLVDEVREPEDDHREGGDERREGRVDEPDRREEEQVGVHDRVLERRRLGPLHDVSRRLGKDAVRPEQGEARSGQLQ